jgi:hypothetical protein
VFRELASWPIGINDYLLGAAQGITGVLALSKEQNAGASSTLAEIFFRSLMVGSILGIASLLLMGVIYTRLGARAGKPSARNQVIHVLAYGGVPMAASLVVWLLTALLAGETTFEAVPRPDLEGFVAILLRAQFFACLLLSLWSVVIQVMGLSEILGVATRKAFWLWVLGQVVGVLAMLFLVIVLSILVPNLMLDLAGR